METNSVETNVWRLMCGVFLGNFVSIDKRAKWQTIYRCLTTISECSMLEYGVEELTTLAVAVGRS